MKKLILIVLALAAFTAACDFFTAPPTPTPAPTRTATPSPQRQESALPQASPVAQPQEGTTYVVQSGDTLYGIAQKFGTTVEAILKANDIASPDKLSIGQKLVIPKKGP